MAVEPPDDSAVGQFRCGTSLLAEENRLLLQQTPFQPLTAGELQAMGRADGSGFVVQDTLGQVKQFWAQRVDTGQSYQVSATLRRVTTHGYIYVDNLRPTSESALTAMALNWDHIYTTVTQIFGDIPDVDGDPRVTILLLDILDGSTGSGYVAGYFSSRNEIPLATSNLREMFYIDSNPGTPGDRTSLFTLAHEFQHLINWNYHKQSGGQDEWLNEGLSDMAGYLAGYGHDDNLVAYLQDPNDSLVNWSNVAKDYGSVHLFMLYTWERYGGHATLRTITQHSGQSVDAYDAGLAAFGAPDRFRDVFQKWTIANYLDDDVSAGGAYGYKNLTLVSGGANNQTTFLRAALSGNFTSYAADTTNSVQRWGVRYFSFSSSAAGNLQLSLNGSDSTAFGASVVSSASSSFGAGTNTISTLTLNGAQDGAITISGIGTTIQQALLVASSQQNGSTPAGFSVSAMLTPTTAGTPTQTSTPNPSATASSTATPSSSPTPTATTTSGTSTPVATGSPTATSTPGGPAVAAPSLAGPANGVMLSSLSASLAWTNPSGTVQYQIQVLPANNDGPAINLIRNAETSFTVSSPVFGQGPYIMLPGMTYQWRVRATAKATSAAENDPAWGPWSAFKAFRTPPPSSTTITALDPSSGSTISAAPRDLRWIDSVPSVFYYEVQVSGDARFDVNPATATSFVWWNLVHGGVTNPLNSWRTPPIQANATYFWRVRPRVQGDGTAVAWSQTFFFSTGPQ